MTHTSTKTSHRRRSARRGALAAVLMALALGCATPSDSPPTAHAEDTAPPERDARAILERSAEALRAVPAVTHEFVWGGVDDPAGWVTGLTHMVRRTDVADGWIRVTGTVHPQPRFEVTGHPFDYTQDGVEAWASDDGTTWRRARIGDGANSLSATAVFGYLPEFAEPSPLWRELGPGATATLAGTEIVDDELCDVVEVVFEPRDGLPATARWSIARRDSLPRRGRWAPSVGMPEMELTLRDLVVGPSLAKRDFQVAVGDDETVDASLGSGVGERVPAFSLKTPDGRAVTDEDLTGRVTVLDFWNTWCVLCRSMAPDTRALARALDDPRVQFFGVNVFETGDPVGYWRDADAPYPLLLEGEDLAQALDLPWQPGVTVIGGDGDVVWKRLGAMPERDEAIRSAVERALEALDAGHRASGARADDG